MTEFIRFSKIQGNFNMGTLWYLWVSFVAFPISSSSQGNSRKLGSSDMWLLNKWDVNDSYSYSVPNFESSRISVLKISYFGDGLVTKSCPALVTPWTVARQAPLSVGFSRQEYWSGLPFSSPGDLPNRGIKPTSPASVGGFLPLQRLHIG